MLGTLRRTAVGLLTLGVANSAMAAEPPGTVPPPIVPAGLPIPRIAQPTRATTHRGACDAANRVSTSTVPHGAQESCQFGATPKASV